MPRYGPDPEEPLSRVRQFAHDRAEEWRAGIVASARRDPVSRLGLHLKKGPTPMKTEIRTNLSEVVIRATRMFPGPFTREDLAVTAWRMNPCVCGLRGFEEDYPDAHRVFATLCGTKGLVAKGYLRRLADGRYELGEGN